MGNPSLSSNVTSCCEWLSSLHINIWDHILRYYTKQRYLQRLFCTAMVTQQMKIRNRNLFLPLDNQVAEFMKMHDQKIKEYQDYLNYLHFNIIQNARNEQNKKEFKVPPPTPAMVPFQQFTFPPPSVPVSGHIGILPENFGIY